MVLWCGQINVLHKRTVEIYYMVQMWCTLTVWSEETKKGGEQLTLLIAWVVSVSAILKLVAAVALRAVALYIHFIS